MPLICVLKMLEMCYLQDFPVCWRFIIWLHFRKGWQGHQMLWRTRMQTKWGSLSTTLKLGLNMPCTGQGTVSEFDFDSGTCFVSWKKGKAAKILTFQCSFDLVSNLVNESGDAYRWCSRSGPYSHIVDCWHGINSIYVILTTLEELTTFRRQVYSHYPNVEAWVLYAIVKVCFWWLLWQACFSAHSPKDATSSDLNEQQTLGCYDSVGRSLRCWNKWNGATKTETAAAEEQVKCTSFMHAGCCEVSSIGSLAPAIWWAPRLVKTHNATGIF